jgi:uncharacterized protein
MPYAGKRIDTDVHHLWKSADVLIDYLPKRWRDYMRMPERGKHAVDPPLMLHPVPQGIARRLDALPADGSPAGSDYELMRMQLLDKFNLERVVLSFDIGQTPGIANLDLAVAMCRAANDWSIDLWLGRPDDRLYGGILVPTQSPVEAAAEIRRVGGHPRVCEVLIVSAGLGRAFGDPVYHPIYEAAAEMDLTVALHIGGEIFYPGTAHVVAGGPPLTRLERHTLHMQPSQRHLLSFITHGVFERYPRLRLIIKETGLGLYPWLLPEMDGIYDELRTESSWVRKRPSDYFFSNVWLSTQPLDESPQPRQLIDLLETVDGLADRLCFSTDYPHHDADEPGHDDRLLPDRWWDRVYFENPARAYGWSELLAGRGVVGATTAA